MKKCLLLLLFLTGSNVFAQDLTTRYERSGAKETPTYFEIINWWKKLDAVSGKVKMLQMGPTDAGYPLHLVMVAQHGDYDPRNIKRNNKRIIFINNGIHPGEPDGIDASMLLARDIVTNKLRIPGNVVLAIIPVYNIGGCLNRSKNYRIDQHGPEEKGFRGNSQNLDLNRDFIKCDSKEARSFTKIFQWLDPDIFIDNHVSDGADYQHVMTLVSSQHNKLGGAMGKFMNEQFRPGIFSLMKEKGYDLVPYVNSFGDNVENGWPEFWDGPRYSSGYATLWHTFAFVPETHMLKPYKQRVEATYDLMRSFIEFSARHSEQIRQLRDLAKATAKSAKEFTIDWTLDKTKFDSILYKGYASGRKTSQVSGLSVLYYDRTNPFEKKIPYYNQYKPERTVSVPSAYIIPQGWWRVIDLLKLNRVSMRQFRRDTTLTVEVYRIEEYKSAARPYEMHHPNSDVKISASMMTMKFLKGDYYIPLNQPANRFLVETLEPHAEDSYFAWNFFDGILGQKEGYSGYSFEDIASEYLNRNPQLRQKLEDRKATDTVFAKNARAQLNFVYQHSPYYEPDHMRYPVYRVR